MIESFVHDLEPDDIFYDVGANLGIYSSFAGQTLGDDGMVSAFDPNPSTLSLLYKNISFNCSNFEVFSLALSDRHGFGRTETEFATGADIRESVGVNVWMDRLDDISDMADLPTPTAMKIDVEGAELDVLRGCGELLSDVEILYVEVHENKLGTFGGTVEEVLELLERNFDDISQLAESKRGKGAQKHIRATSRDA